MSLKRAANDEREFIQLQSLLVSTHTHAPHKHSSVAVPHSPAVSHSSEMRCVAREESVSQSERMGGREKERKERKNKRQQRTQSPAKDASERERERESASLESLATNDCICSLSPSLPHCTVSTRAVPLQLMIPCRHVCVRGICVSIKRRIPCR